MKYLILITMAAMLTACQPDYTVKECTTTTGSEIVCAEYRYKAEDFSVDMSAKDWIDYNALSNLVESSDISLNVLAQVYADTLKQRHQDELNSCESSMYHHDGSCVE